MQQVGSVVPRGCRVAIPGRLYGYGCRPVRASPNLSLRYSRGLDRRWTSNDQFDTNLADRSTRPGDPSSGSNSRKSMVRSVEGSLSRLQTDYIDLLQVTLDPGQQARLDEVSAIELGFPHEALRRLASTR